jgi:dTDP-4-amino-4,6-dideoxygalactose transaminase
MSEVAVDAIEFAGCRREHLEMAEPLAVRVAEVLATGQMLQGPEVAAFEGQIAEACQRRHAVCVGSGTDALFFALVALGIGPGDEVLTPDVSFIASAAAVLRTGAAPVFVDIDASCNLDLDRAAEVITERTRALLFVQLFGGMGDPVRIEAFAREHGLLVVEDAAQSFGARFAGRACGSVSILSFDPMKVLSAPGSGGALLTDDGDLARRARRLRYHGKAQDRYLELGYNSQLPSLAAAVLSLKLERQPAWTARRRAIAELYRESFADLPIELPVRDPAVDHVWHKFTLRVAARDDLMGWLKAAGVPTLVHYPRPFHREDLFRSDRQADFPRADHHAAHTLSLPIHAQLSDGELGRVVDAVAGFFG